MKREKISRRLGKKYEPSLPLYTSVDWDKAQKIFQRQGSEQKENQRNIPTKDLLRMAAAVGTIGLIFLCPPAGAAIGKLILDDQKYQRWKLRQTLKQLQKQKYISVSEKEDGSVTVTITKEGMKRALTYQLDTMALNMPKKWDKKWRVIIFDIPDRYRRTRDVFRKRLEQLELKQLQKSVWVSPYPCFDEVEFLRELYGIAVTVQYLLVEKIENDDALKRQFNLSS